MTLQDDIQKARRDWIGQDGIKPSIVELFAAGLEREKIIIPKADLPKVEDSGCAIGAGGSGGTVLTGDAMTLDYTKTKAAEYLALHEHIKARKAARESAEARLQERRDELAREFWDYCQGTYAELVRGSKDAVDRIIELEAR